MKKIIYILAFCFGTLTHVFAQDAVFSNPALSTIHLNPALTGVMASNQRLHANYRHQYGFLGREAFSTYAVGYDQRFAIGKYDFFGGGLSILADQAGALSFKTNHVKLSGSYIKRIGGRRSVPTYLVAGFELGLVRKSVDLSRAEWGTQHDGNGGVDTDAFSGAMVLDRTAIHRLDLGSGLLFYINDVKQGKNLYIGAAYFHVNRFDQSFSTANESRIQPRFTLYTGGEFPIDGLPKNIRLMPNLTFHHQSPSMQLLGGSAIRFELLKNNQDAIFIRFGANWRFVNHRGGGLNSEAIVWSSRLDYNQLSVGLSFDMTLSNLNRVNNGFGAFELGLTYQMGDQQNRAVFCPGF